MLIFFLKFIHIWRDCISCFQYKTYLLAENQKTDFAWSDELGNVKATSSCWQSNLSRVIFSVYFHNAVPFDSSDFSYKYFVLMYLVLFVSILGNYMWNKTLSWSN